MKIEQIYTGCLAQGAYYIESNGEVAIIDPLREVSPYVKRAEKDSANIKYIFETHFHADFVSGHVTLAEQTDAKIIFGPTATTKFNSHIAEDNEEFKLGDLIIKVLHTPGHTLESISLLLKDKSGKDIALFSGDTLFLGDVGRPDLAQKSNITLDDLAGMLYDSLRNKIMPLADDLTVYPAHGAGSACGKNMMKETVDTLGNQKKTNYALRADMTKEEFIKEVTDGLATPPGYFPENVRLNKEGYDDIKNILGKGTTALSPAVFETIANETGALMLDVRSASDFAKAHVPNSIFIGLDGGFAPWVGQLIVDVNQEIILITDKGREEEAVTRLARIGFDNTLGYLDGGIKAWKAEKKDTESIDCVSAEEFTKQYDKNISFDVRKEGEFLSEHVLDINHTPLCTINEHLSEFPKEKFFVHCAGGYRSMMAASILKSRGFDKVINVEGGFKAIKETNIPVSAYVCPSTL